MTQTPGGALKKRPADTELDSLTRTLTRQAFVARLTERAERAVHDVAGYGLCLLDLDHFKNINLSHGPDCGDDALRDIARRLVRTNLPGLEDCAAQIVGRYDGNAFAVLIDTASMETLGAAAHALHRSVRESSSVTGSQLSASVGAVIGRIGESAGAVSVRAEQALYLAKQFGRDRVEIGKSPLPLATSGDVLPLRRTG